MKLSSQINDPLLTELEKVNPLAASLLRKESLGRLRSYEVSKILRIMNRSHRADLTAHLKRLRKETALMRSNIAEALIAKKTPKKRGRPSKTAPAKQPGRPVKNLVQSPAELIRFLDHLDDLDQKIYIDRLADKARVRCLLRKLHSLKVMYAKMAKHQLSLASATKFLCNPINDLACNQAERLTPETMDYHKSVLNEPLDQSVTKRVIYRTLKDAAGHENHVNTLRSRKDRTTPGPKNVQQTNPSL